MKILYGTGNPAKQTSINGDPSDLHKEFLQNFDEKTLPMIELILEGMPGGFFIYHADEKEELIYANRGILRIFGCDTEEEFRELTGYTFRGMVYPEDFDGVEKSIREQIANSVYDLDYVEYRIVQKDGSVRWVEDYGHFLHTETYGDIFLVFIEDATDRKKQRMQRLERANEELRIANERESQYKQVLQAALQRAEAANMARSIFLSNMSHDIRTPLNAIIGYTELIRNHVMEPDKVDEYNKKIRISGEQLLSIVDESLEITRMESGKVNLVESQCHLADLLADVERAMMFEVNAKSLHFLLDKSGIKRFAVIADYMRVKEILCQLLDNAVKYTDPEGHISLTVEEAENDFPGYGMYRFLVEDDGIGISKDFIGSLFDPFKRENNTTQSGVPGTGLGLTVVKNMVDMMKGDIEVTSEPGKGSRFTVSLRLKLQEGQEHNGVTLSENLPGQDILKGKRILLVEDNEINMEIARELLTTQGFLVDTAEDGSLALEKVESSGPGHYDLILMDIQMPVMNGHEATRRIRQLADSRLAHIPIIALSANAFAEDYQKSMDAGMNAHFPKPIDIQELQELIQSVLSKSSHC